MKTGKVKLREMAKTIKRFYSDRSMRFLFAFALAELIVHWLIIKWYVKTTYLGFEADFILNGFPLPFETDWGIVSRYGNSGDVAFSFLNYLLDFLFWWLLIFILTFFIRKVFQNLSKIGRVFIIALLGIAILNESLFWLFTTIGDLHPWFDNHLEIIKVEFWNSRHIQTMIREQNQQLNN